MKNRIKACLSLVLLLYFAGFAVAPVSAILPGEQCADIGKEQDSLERRSHQTDVFLYDLALWDILTKVKRSDHSKDFIAAVKKSNGHQKFDFSGIAVTLPDSGGTAPLPRVVISKYICNRISIVHHFVYFYHTDLAPPSVV